MGQIAAEKVVKWAGALQVQGEPVACAGVFTDSRQPILGGLFVALAGENFDGHNFVATAIEKGAAGALVNAARYAELAAQLKRQITDRPWFLVAVENTLDGLQSLAREYRRSKQVSVIGITGSNGKTTTKEIAAFLLADQVNVLASKGNFNNDIGLPLTLFELKAEHDVCVLEMGMRGRGQIARLAAVAEPNIGIVTNVGPVHLELLGTIDNVALAKQELVQALPDTGTAILNADDTRVAAMAAASPAKVISYGYGNEARVQARDLEQGKGSTSFTLFLDGAEAGKVVCNLPGKHNVYNALAALGAVWVSGYDVNKAMAALAHMPAVSMRLEVRPLSRGVTLVNDCYNASPMSMRSALDFLAAQSGRHVAVLGEMLELGPEREKWHVQVGSWVAKNGVDLLVAVGDGGRLIAEGAVNAGFEQRLVSVYQDAAEAAATVDDWLQDGDSVLIKASRGIRLEQVTEAMLKRG